MCQTRYDIAFLTLKAATLISDACRDTAILEQLMGVFRRIYKVLRGKSVTIRYHCFPDFQLSRGAKSFLFQMQDLGRWWVILPLGPAIFSGVTLFPAMA